LVIESGEIANLLMWRILEIKVSDQEHHFVFSTSGFECFVGGDNSG
jgi:hypothetical protein